MFSILLTKITSILSANTLIEETFNYEVEQFKGDPVAVVSPSGNESDYSTTNLNERIYAYSVKLFVARGDRGAKESDRVLRNLVDSVLDDFDSDYYFSGLSVPTGYTMINVFALPTLWGYSGREDEFRVAEVIVKCRVSVDVTLINA